VEEAGQCVGLTEFETLC